MASWYGQEFAGRTTANGEIFDPMLMTAAHRTLPFGTIARGEESRRPDRRVRVRVNDRGPYVGDRLIDLSYAAAQQIGIVEQRRRRDRHDRGEDRHAAIASRRRRSP